MLLLCLRLQHVLPDDSLFVKLLYWLSGQYWGGKARDLRLSLRWITVHRLERGLWSAPSMGGKARGLRLSSRWITVHRLERGLWSALSLGGKVLRWCQVVKAGGR